MSDHRLVRASEVKSTGGHGFTARVLSYGVIDDYDTVFDPSCARASLAKKMPLAAWGHDRLDPIGRATRVVTDDAKSLVLAFRLDVSPSVPRAGQALTQLRSGTISDFSVGFRTRSKYVDDDGIVHFREIELDEVSLVLAAAVPGTELLSVRSRVGAARDRVLGGRGTRRPSRGVTRALEREADRALDDLDRFLLP